MTLAPFGYCRYCGTSERIIERGTCRGCSMLLQGWTDEDGVHDAQLLTTRFHDSDGGEIVPDRNGHALCMKCGPKELRA